MSLMGTDQHVDHDDQWHAYCTACDNYLDSAKNGNMVQAAAERHNDETGHKPLLGQHITGEA